VREVCVNSAVADIVAICSTDSLVDRWLIVALRASDAIADEERCTGDYEESERMVRAGRTSHQRHALVIG
jgi:hypothetical protein